MKKRKMYLSLLLTMGMITACFSGCGVKSTSETDGSASKTTSDSSSEEMTGDGAVEKGTSGTLTVYTALEDDVIQGYLQSFYEQYPDIELNIVRDSTGTIIAKALAEKDNPVADVIWGTAASVTLQLDSNDLIKAYTPEGADRIDEKFKGADENGELKWTGIDVPEAAFLVNKKECEAAGVPVPTSWNDLIDPQYAGMIVMPDPTSSGTGLLSVNGILQTMGEEEGWEYLEKLNENISMYTASGSKPAKMAADGECVIGLSMGYRCASLYQENPDDLVVVFPSEGSGWDVEANCLINKAEINPCAYTFLDWAISDEAMKAYSKEYPITGIGVIGELPEGYSDDPMSNLVEMDLAKAAEDRDAILEKFTPFLSGKN